MDWWFDIDGKICRVELYTRALQKPSVTFEGEVGGAFVECRTFRNGCSYVYTTEGDHMIFINEVKSRGERFFSLYVDRTLIKEYNVRAEKSRGEYYAHPDAYDAPAAYARSLSVWALLAGLFAALALTALASFFNLFATLAQAAICALALTALLSTVFYVAALALYRLRRSRMERYAIVSSVKRQKRLRAAKAKLKRRKRFF